MKIEKKKKGGGGRGKSQPGLLMTLALTPMVRYTVGAQ